MAMRKLFCLLLLAACPVQAADSVEVAAIKLETSIAHTSGKTLVLNGAGIRKKLFFKIYVGALYLENKSTDAGSIIQGGKANRIIMHFVYDKVSREKITSAWTSGFEKNLDPAELQKLKDKITAFNALFVDARAGDRILLDFVPETGTTVTMNNKVMGTVPGQNFNSALLSIWLGKHPVTPALKDAMLGKN